MTSLTYGVMFKAEMVQAYMAGVKTQTRRLKGLDEINQMPDSRKFSGWMWKDHRATACFQSADSILKVKSPYGFDQDTIWIKETYGVICKVADPLCWCETDEEIRENHYVEYRADTGNPYPGEWPAEEAKGNDEALKWRSAMFMPHKSSRFTDIPILNVRVERLHDITVADAFAEGVRTNYLNQRPDWIDKQSYAELWDKINGKTYPWSDNPWVFVYEFPKYQKE